MYNGILQELQLLIGDLLAMSFNEKISPTANHPSGLDGRGHAGPRESEQFRHSPQRFNLNSCTKYNKSN